MPQRGKPLGGAGRPIGLLIIGAVLLLACRLTAAAPTATVVAPANASQTSTPQPTIASPTPPPTAAPQACAVPAGNPALPAAQGAAMVGYLNQGGPPQALAQQYAGDLTQLDLDADGMLDLALASNADPQGQLFVFHCTAGAYELAYVSPELPSPGMASIQASTDLTGDGIADLLISIEQCGAHTCSAQVEALVWVDGRLSNRLSGETGDLPSPVIEWTRTESGSAAIQVTATGIASVGAGPFRKVTRSWLWDSDQQLFLPQPDQLLPSEYRIHRLHDADDAAAAGNLDGALALYQQVISDTSLDDWVSGEMGHQQLAAYARFRRMLAILQIGDLESAEEELSQLQGEHPPGSPGAGFSAMGDAFWSAFASANGGAQPPGSTAIAAGCQAAQAFSLTHSEQTLDLLYYGYANRSYTAGDLCPAGP